MAEMEKLLQIPQLDANLFDFLNLAVGVLSDEDKYFKEGLYDALKDHVYGRLNKYRKDHRARKFSVMLSSSSFDLFSESENSLAISYAEAFHKFRKDYQEQNKHLSELQNSPVFIDVYSKFSGVKLAYDQFRDCLADERRVCLIRPDAGKISEVSAVYNDAVKEMASLFVKHGLVSLGDVSDLKQGDVFESFQVLNSYIEQLNDFLAGSDDLDDERLRDGLSEIDSSFDSEVFDNVLDHIKYVYTGHKTLDWPGVYNGDYRSGKSSGDSLFGLLYHLNFPSEYSVRFWEEIFEDLGFEIEKSEGQLMANISFKEFMALDFQIAEKN